MSETSRMKACDEACPQAAAAAGSRLYCLLLAMLMMVLAASTVASEETANLKTQLQALAERHGFTVIGLHKLAEESGKPVDGDASQQLRELLRNYNYLAVHNDLGRVDQVVITSRKRPASEAVSGYRVKTTRRGRHHLVKAVLVGPSGARQTAALIVDTGASDVVLPQSMSRRLGFEQAQLRDAWSQTANGRVRTKRGVIQSLRVGQAEAENVTVNFVEDKALGGIMLLGMSFLGRFQVTIDDENDRLVLMNK